MIATSNSNNKKRRKVWHDPDDEITDEIGVKGRRVHLEARAGQSYSDRLRLNFEIANGPTPAWADLDNKNKSSSKNDSDSDEEESIAIPTGSTGALPQGQLSIHRVVDLDMELRNESGVMGIGFHPKLPVSLIAGRNGAVNIYQVDGAKNAHIQSIMFENYKISKAKFSGNGEEIYVAGPCNYMYCYDMKSGVIRKIKPSRVNQFDKILDLVTSPDGKFILTVCLMGHLYLFSQGSKEVIHTFQMNSQCNGAGFTPDGKQIIAVEQTGEIYRWDVASRKCLEKFSCVTTFDAFSLSVSKKYFGVGSSFGYVNVYPNEVKKQDNNTTVICNDIRKPFKEVKSLTSKVEHITINSTDEILAMSSHRMLKMVHLPTMTTFQGFPTPGTKYGHISSIAFSPSSGYFGVSAFASKRVYLYRLKHYTEY